MISCLRIKVSFVELWILLRTHILLIYKMGAEAWAKNWKKDLEKASVLDEEDEIMGVYIKMGLENIFKEIHKIGEEDKHRMMQILVKVYLVIELFQQLEVKVETKYKKMYRKMKPVAQPLPSDSNKFSKLPREEIEGSK